MNHAPTEALLDRFDCTYTFDPDLDLRRIDRVASTTNQSRFEPIDEPTVERYVAALETGAEFPPILVRLIATADRTTGEQLVILGGNHRLRAHADAGRKTIATYLVVCDDVTALELAYADNATHGLPPTKAEQIAHALLLVETHGRSMSHAARVVGINSQQITAHVARRATEARAGRLGVAVELTKVGSLAHARLASVRDDRVFIKVIRAIAANAMPGKVADRIITDINAQTSVASALDILAAHIREFRATPAGRGAGRPSSNPAIMLRAALGTIRGLNAADIADRCTTARERKLLHEDLVAGGRHLMAIDQLLKVTR